MAAPSNLSRKERSPGANNAEVDTLPDDARQIGGKGRTDDRKQPKARRQRGDPVAGPNGGNGGGYISGVVSSLEAAQIATLQKQLDEANARIKTLQSKGSSKELEAAQARAKKAESAIKAARARATDSIATADRELTTAAEKLSASLKREEELEERLNQLRLEGDRKDAELRAIMERADGTSSRATMEEMSRLAEEKRNLEQRATQAEQRLALIQKQSDEREARIPELETKLETRIRQRFERADQRIMEAAEAELSADDKAALELVIARRAQEEELVDQGIELTLEIWTKMNALNKGLRTGIREDYTPDVPSIFQTLETEAYMVRVESIRKRFMYRMVDETEVGNAEGAREMYRAWLFFELDFALTLYLTASFQSDYDAVLDNLARTNKPDSPGLLESFLMQNPDISPPFSAERFNDMVAAYEVRTRRVMSRLQRV